jgi:hypothetical protein
LTVEAAMDAEGFDRAAKLLGGGATRRGALALGAGVASRLGVGRDAAQAAKCKKRCGPCKRCKKGQCKKKPGMTPCGPCSGCQEGRCVARCAGVDCVNERCVPACDPPCASTEDCIGGSCFTRCEPPCDAEHNQGCITGACTDLAVGCTVDDGDGTCTSQTPCPDGDDTSRGIPTCAVVDGQPFCAVSVLCNADGSDLCQTHEDCRNEGQGPNARCVAACDTCDGGNGCLEFYLDFA